MISLLMFYDDLYNELYIKIYTSILSNSNLLQSKETSTKFELVDGNKIKTGAFVAIEQLQRELTNELCYNVSELNCILSRERDITVSFNLSQEPRINLAGVTELVNEVIDYLNRLPNFISRFISNNIYRLAYLYAVSKLLDFDFQPSDKEVYKDHLNSYHSLITIATHPSIIEDSIKREDKSSNDFYRNLIDFIRHLEKAPNTDANILEQLVKYFNDRARFVQEFSKIGSTFTYEIKNIGDFFYELLHKIYKNDMKEEELLEFLLNHLIIKRKIIDIVIFRLIVANIGLPTALNMMHNKNEYPIVMPIRYPVKDKNEIELKIIEIKMDQEISKDDLVKESKKIIDNLFPFLKPKDIIWLLPHEVELSNTLSIEPVRTLSIYKFIENPYVILQYIYHYNE